MSLTSCWSLVTLRRGIVFTVIRGHVYLSTDDGFSPLSVSSLLNSGVPSSTVVTHAASVLGALVVLSVCHDIQPHVCFSCPRPGVSHASRKPWLLMGDGVSAQRGAGTVFVAGQSSQREPCELMLLLPGPSWAARTPCPQCPSLHTGPLL